MKKKLKRLLLYASIAVGVVVVVPLIMVFFFQDQIVQQFIEQANKQIGTPVKVQDVDISIWEDFPNVSIVFHDIYVEDSHAGESPLLVAKEISFHIDPTKFWQGQYTILGLQIAQGEIRLKINKKGENNYTVLKGIEGDGELIDFDLRDIRLTETSLFYEDEKLGQQHRFNSQALRVSIVASTWYEVMSEGDIAIDQIGIGSYAFLQNKRFYAKIGVRYNREQDHLIIKPSSLTLRQSQFELQGEHTPALLNIVCKGKNTTIQTLLSLLPEKLSNRVAKYKSDGDVYFNLALKHKISDGNKPALSIQFGLRNTALFHVDYPSRIEGVNLEGYFVMPSLTSLSSASISLRNITGKLNQHSFEGGIDIKNFDDPYLKFNFLGDLDGPSIVRFYPIDGLDSIQGKISADIAFDGRIGLLKNKTNINRVVTSGAITMHHLGFTYGQHKSQFKNLNGTFRFTNNNLMLDDVMGQFERTDFRVNGLFKNIVTFLLFKNQPIGIEADIKSDFIDIDQLFDIGFKKGESVDYEFSILPNLHLNLNYDVKSLRYQRFKPTRLTGNLLIKNQVAVLRNIAFHAIGGDFLFNSVIDAKHNKAVDLMGSFKLNGIHIDSTFYVFENFWQDFIKDQHLKGRVFADMDLEMVLSEKLRLIPKTLVANISAKIQGGELNNFAPLQELNKYIPDNELNHLRFADIKNDIMIEDETIYIPFMEVKSNATTIDFSGTHTFDQKIDYRLVVPFRAKKKADSDEAFGKVEEDLTGKSKLFLKIKGTTGKYEITYDKEAVKDKIAADIKKEITELKEAFLLKGKKKKKEVEVEVGNYFDWDDTTRVHNE